MRLQKRSEYFGNNKSNKRVTSNREFSAQFQSRKDGTIVILTALKAHLARILILTLILISALPIPTRGTDRREVTATIDEAEQAIAIGFEAALDAEQAGANVSSLLVKLNEGTVLLSAARMALEDGDPDEASRLSGLSIEIGAQVESEALILRTEASNAAHSKFQLYLASSAVAIVIVLLATLFGYRLVKKRYSERLLKMKPEVEKA